MFYAISLHFVRVIPPVNVHFCVLYFFKESLACLFEDFNVWIFKVMNGFFSFYTLQVEFDPSTLNGTSYSRVFVTANVKGHFVRYQSNVSYDMLEVVMSARNMAVELWKKWGN